MTDKKKAPEELINPFTEFVNSLGSASIHLDEDDAWDEEPASFEEFVSSKKYLGLPPLSARQLQAFKEGLQHDGKQLFDGAVNSYHELLLVWGKGCVSGETQLFDEYTRRTYTIKECAEQQRSLYLKTETDEDGVYEDWCYPPQVMGTDQLHKVTFSDGRSVRVTNTHLFWSEEDGWVTINEITPGVGRLRVLPPYANHQRPERPLDMMGLAVGGLIGAPVCQVLEQENGCGLIIPEELGSSHEDHGFSVLVTDQMCSLSSPGACVQRSMDIKPSYQEYYPACHYYSCDERPQSVISNDQVVSPSQDDVPLHTHQNSHKDGQVGVEEHIHLCPQRDHHWACIDRRDHEVSCLCQQISDGGEESPQVCLIGQKALSELPLTRTPVSTLQCSYNPPEPLSQFVTVMSIEPDGEEDYYDLTMPRSECYFDAQGILHHNSGKDYLSAIFISYVTHVLLCLKNPGDYLGLAPGEPLDIVNVASRQEQAQDVFFTKLKNRLQAPWFEKFPHRVKANKIFFYSKNVILHSLHSQAQKWEGYNLIAWVMDEADAFSTQAGGNNNADEVYKVLTSSATSRFPDRRWLGITISYPRSKVGFVLTRAKKERGHNLSYVDIAATWEVHPHYDPTHPSFKDFPWVTVHEKYTVPQPYEKDYFTDPSSAEMTYRCNPPEVEDAFFEYPELLLDACADITPLVFYRPRITTREVLTHVKDENTGALTPGTEQRQYTAIEIVRQQRVTEGYQYWIHGDPGETHDAFALTIGHTLPEEITVEGLEQTVILNRVEVDQVIEWKPEPGKPVDYLNVRDVILWFCQRYPVLQVTFDKFQSVQIMQELIEAGINAKQMSFSQGEQLRMYLALKAAVYHHTITWPAVLWGMMENGLTQLRRIGNKITHDEKVSPKDIPDALAAMHWFASGAGLSETARAVRETIYGSSSDGLHNSRESNTMAIVRKQNFKQLIPKTQEQGY